MNKTANFQASISGVDTDINLRHHASGLVVYRGFGGFYVAVPGRAKTGGVRAIDSAATIEAAIATAERYIEKFEAKMNKIHAAALKLNGAR